jgi:glutathione synthase/RimK-type ligase-like ATP-grasp enzyme
LPHEETEAGESAADADHSPIFGREPFESLSSGGRDGPRLNGHGKAQAGPTRAGASMEQHIVVVERRSDLKWAADAHRVITAKDYIANAESFKPNTRVINLSRSHAYLGYGFYSSLLAEARRHRVIPTVRTMLDLSRKSSYRFALTELDALLRKRMQRIADPPNGAFSLRLFFGEAEDRRFAALGRRVFDLFRCPLLDIQIRWKDGDWLIHAIRPVSVDALRPDQERRFAATLAAYTRATWRTPKEKAPPQKTIAILHNPKEAMPPSDAKALQKFARVGESLGVAVELITKRDFEKLAEYDALFIRETTAIDHHTYRFAKRAEREGIPVIDDPTSILRCFNKVFLAELLSANKVPTPKTMVVDARNLLTVEQQIGYPVVLKIPDGSFSRGVLKASDQVELRRIADALFEESDVILAQEFMYTDFDWRVGVLNRQPIFACKYRMARHHWQVIKHVGNGTVRMGSAETIPVEQAPASVIATAVKAAGLIGDGLYGVDLKETPRGVFVIEVNDNPNIEHGCEDNVLKDELYRMILRDLLRRMDEAPSVQERRPAPALRVVNHAASAE